MLERVFLSVINMELTAVYVILLVLFLRFLLRKQPKIYSYALWSVVLFRLLCPFSLESTLSLIPVKKEPIPAAVITSTNPYTWTVSTGVEAVDRVVTDPLVNPLLYETSSSALASNLRIFAFLWLLGMGIMLLYSLFSLYRLCRHLKKAELFRENIYLCCGLETAFVLGWISPKIYLPDGLSTEEQRYILLHEQTHIRRLDHWLKLLAFVALCIHWFDPLVWLAFFLAGQDMEMSCDEAVITRLGSGVKKAYSTSLLSLASGKRLVAAMPLAFGEGDTKKRIKNVLSYKKPAFWLLILLAAVVAAAGIGLISDPPKQLDAAQAAAAVKESLHYEEEKLSFTIPKNYKQPSDFNIQIYGTTQTGDQRMSVHCLEEENAQRSWKRGKTYSISLNSDGINSFVELSMSIYMDSDPEVEETVDLLTFYLSKSRNLEELWNNRTAYLGDNAKVANLAALLPYPENCTYAGIQIQTAQEPYELCVLLSTDEETRRYWETAHTLNGEGERLNEDAFIFRALIGNVGQIAYCFDDGEGEPLKLDWFTGFSVLAPGSLFQRSETLEGFEQLMTEWEQAKAAQVIRDTPDTTDPDMIAAASLLSYSEHCSFAGIQLQRVEPIDLIIQLQVDKALHNWAPAGLPEEAETQFRENAMVLLTLFDELDGVGYEYSDGYNTYRVGAYKREAFSNSQYAAVEPKAQELREKLREKAEKQSSASQSQVEAYVAEAKAENYRFSAGGDEWLEIAQAGISCYFEAYMGEDVPKECRILDYSIGDVRLAAYGEKEFMVHAVSDYSTSGLYFLSANGAFVPQEDGTYSCTEDMRDFRFKQVEDGVWEIVSIGTGGGGQGLTPVEG